MIIGEHFIGMKQILKRFLKVLITKKKITTNFYELFQPAPVLGRHYYRRSDYYFMFKSMGYILRHKDLKIGSIYCGQNYINMILITWGLIGNLAFF